MSKEYFQLFDAGLPGAGGNANQGEEGRTSGGVERATKLITSLTHHPSLDEELPSDEFEEESRVPQVKRLYTLLLDLRVEAGAQAEQGAFPEDMYQTIASVTRGFSFLAYDLLPPYQQAVILREMRHYQKYNGSDSIELTYEEGQLLHQVANAAGIAFDPGEPEQPAKRSFVFAELEQKVPDPSTLPQEIQEFMNSP